MNCALFFVLLVPFTVRADDCVRDWMHCAVDSPLQINSFTVQAAQTITGITAARAKAIRALQHHKITVAQAKVVLAQTDLGRQLWDSARAACHADNNGNCDTPEHSRKAFALLELARRTGQ